MTLKYFKVFAAGLSLLLWSGTAHAQATLSRLEEDFTRAGGIYHSYEFTEIEENTIIIEAYGVGYEVTVPASVDISTLAS